MKIFLITICFLLTSCGTMDIRANGPQRSIAFTRQSLPLSALSNGETLSAMQKTAFKQCPGGFSTQNQRIDAETHTLVWNITCN